MNTIIDDRGEFIKRYKQEFKDGIKNYSDEELNMKYLLFKKCEHSDISDVVFSNKELSIMYKSEFRSRKLKKLYE